MTFILERVTRGHHRDTAIEPEETAAAFEDTLAFWRALALDLGLPWALAGDGRTARRWCSSC